jgi:murein DD-endopeptidase MepM/ murein hydrolase activator NlpD
MSKKRKSHRKPVQEPAKKVIVPPTAIKATNGRARPVTAETRIHKGVAPAPAANAEPVTVAHDQGVRLPFWARMPFAIMDFWWTRPERGHGKS